ncbi:MAG: patatin-like phospholipase family protein [bacterium]
MNTQDSAAPRVKMTVGQIMKKALVLGVGGAKGFAHVGAIQALEEIGWRPDLVVGASMGSIIGALYCSALTIKEIRNECETWDQFKFARMATPTLSTQAPLSGKGLIAHLKKITGDPDFKDLKIPLALIATEADTGYKIVISSGNVASAVRGSAAILGVFTPHPWGKTHITDGGLVEPLPVRTARELGADYVLAVDVLGEMPKDLAHAPLGPRIYMKSVAMYQRALTRLAIEQADLVIQPDMSSVTWGDFKRARSAIQRGYEAAQEVISRRGLAAMSGL